MRKQLLVFAFALASTLATVTLNALFAWYLSSNTSWSFLLWFSVGMASSVFATTWRGLYVALKEYL